MGRLKNDGSTLSIEFGRLTKNQKINILHEAFVCMSMSNAQSENAALAKAMGVTLLSEDGDCSRANVSKINKDEFNEI